MTSWPMPSPGSTAIWKAVLADMRQNRLASEASGALMNTARAPARKVDGWVLPMPRFAANLGYLFTEHPLLERVGAAARAGFKGIELQFPYDVPASAMKAEIVNNKLTILGVNSPRGEREDEFGLAAVPGREKDWEVQFAQGARLRICAIGGSAVHCLAGKVAPEQRPAADRVFAANLAPRRRSRRGEKNHAADRADQSARPAGLFPQSPRTRRRRRSPRSASRTCASSSIFITCRSSAAICSTGWSNTCR